MPQSPGLRAPQRLSGGGDRLAAPRGAPVGYDVYPMLDIAAFKGGGKEHRFRAEQQSAYRNALDEASALLLGQDLSEHQGDFLLVKCFFFLALMRPPTRGGAISTSNGSTVGPSSK